MCLKLDNLKLDSKSTIMTSTESEISMKGQEGQGESLKKKIR